MCQHPLTCERAAPVAGLSTKEELPSRSPPTRLLSLASSQGSLSVALEGALASNELSKLWMTARHTKQLLLAALLRGWFPTTNSCGIPTPWCLQGGRAGGQGTAMPPSASVALPAVRGVAQGGLRAVLLQNRLPDYKRSHDAQLLSGLVSI